MGSKHNQYKNNNKYSEFEKDIDDDFMNCNNIINKLIDHNLFGSSKLKVKSKAQNGVFLRNESFCSSTSKMKQEKDNFKNCEVPHFMSKLNK